MKVNIDNTDYWVSWEHYIPYQSTCQITKQGFVIVGIGNGICSPKDKFDKEIGRKVILARALSKSNFSKENRKQFWSAYLNRKNAQRQ
jgi:hypothetical protein